MSLRMRDAMSQRMAELRHEPTEKRVRAVLGGQVVVDSTRAVLVWEPRRVVPCYAVPADEVRADLVPEKPAGERQANERPAVLHPGIPFAVHSTVGEPLTVRAGEHTREGAAFRPTDPDLTGHVLLDFDAFEWYEEDEALFAHPRDPYHRVDVRASSRHVRIERDGVVLADTSSPTLVFETHLPTRFYLPREDAHPDLRPTRRRTVCPYKGEASYWALPDGRDIAWTYHEPLVDAAPLAGLIAFFDELVDVTVDGVRRPRPGTAFSAAVVEESGV